MSGVRMLHFLKDWWKFIHIHQYYTLALTILCNILHLRNCSSCHRVLYWSDIGSSPKIEMVWLNGQGRQVLVNTTIEMPTGLTIDFSNYDTVYWCDQGLNMIQSMSWDGSNRKLLRHASSESNRNFSCPLKKETHRIHSFWEEKKSSPPKKKTQEQQQKLFHHQIGNIFHKGTLKGDAFL